MGRLHTPTHTHAHTRSHTHTGTYDTGLMTSEKVSYICESLTFWAIWDIDIHGHTNVKWGNPHHMRLVSGST